MAGSFAKPKLSLLATYHCWKKSQEEQAFHGKAWLYSVISSHPLVLGILPVPLLDEWKVKGYIPVMTILYSVVGNIYQPDHTWKAKT